MSASDCEMNDMARLFPFRSEPQTGEGQPRVVDLEGEDADAVFGALSSTMARRIYAQLDSEPGTPSDVADAVDSSIQNVRYHLENLEEAGLIEVVDTWYSSRGNEMSVYATTDGPLIVASDESRASKLRAALLRLVGGIGALAGISLLVQYGLTDWFGAVGSSQDEAVPAEDTAADDADERATGDDVDDEVSVADTEDEPTADEDEAANDDLTDYDTDGTEPADDAETFFDGGPEAVETAFGVIPPGLLFFLGGLVVLVAATAYWYWSRPAY
jgi:DNA-binding transcriptional ArsR family regulator